jgi:hypothetical protein
MQPRITSKSQQLYWLLQLIGWGCLCVMHTIAMLTALDIPWSTAVVEALILDGTGLALSQGLRSFVRRHQWAELSVFRLAWRSLLAALTLGIPLGALTQLTHVAYIQNSIPEMPAMFPGLIPIAYSLIQLSLQIISWTVVFVVWLCLYFTVTGLREYRSSRLVQSEQARSLHLAELGLLRSQLKPHFLFNALNTVSSLIAEDAPRAQSAVNLLARTLRHTLHSRPDELVPLAQEMSIVTDYLELESMRFEDRLRVESAIAAEAVAVRIPVMVLQTLVENAIKHGVAELPSGGLLRINARVEMNELIVEVQNPRARRPSSSGTGLGLRNARERLRLLFGDRASLDLDLSNTETATARLRVPCQP